MAPIFLTLINIYSFLGLALQLPTVEVVVTMGAVVVDGLDGPATREAELSRKIKVVFAYSILMFDTFPKNNVTMSR